MSRANYETLNVFVVLDHPHQRVEDKRNWVLNHKVLSVQEKIELIQYLEKEWSLPKTVIWDRRLNTYKIRL